MSSFQVAPEEVHAAGNAMSSVGRHLDELRGSLRPGVARLADSTGEARCAASVDGFSTSLARALERLVLTFDDLGTVLVNDARTYERTDRAAMPAPAGDRPG